MRCPISIDKPEDSRDTRVLAAELDVEVEGGLSRSGGGGMVRKESTKTASVAMNKPRSHSRVHAITSKIPDAPTPTTPSSILCRTFFHSPQPAAPPPLSERDTPPSRPSSFSEEDTEEWVLRLGDEGEVEAVEGGG